MERLLEREGRQREYKEYLPDYRGVIRTAVAFSNDIGGTIIIGVRDGSGEIVGLSDQQVETYLEEIPQALFDAIAPACRPLVTPKIVGEKKVVEIEIFPGSNKPYYILAQGLERGVYVRVGAHTKRANEDVVRDLQRERDRRFFDEELATTESVDSLDLMSLRSFYGSNTLSNELLLADKAIGLAPITRVLHPTIAGIIVTL